MLSAFIRKCLFLFLPFVLILMPPAFVFLASKEYISFKSMLEMQNDPSRPVLFGPGLSNPTKRYKRLIIERRRPEVLVLGSSTSLQYRSAFFKNPKIFYNGGGAAAAGSFVEYLDALPQDYHPSVIIMHLDYQDFQPQRHDGVVAGTIHDITYDDGRGSWGNFFRRDWRKIYGYLFSGKVHWADLIRNLKGQTYQGMRLVGLNVTLGHFGYRNDGSLRYGLQIEQASERNAQQAITDGVASQILAGSSGHIYADKISTSALGELRNFLDKAKERGIFIIGLQPPYDPKLYTALRNSVRREEYQRVASELSTRLENLFSSRGFEYYDFGNAAAFGGDSVEMITFMHGSEKTYLRLIISMAERSPTLKKYVDVPTLQKRLAESRSPYDVFYNEF